MQQQQHRQHFPTWKLWQNVQEAAASHRHRHRHRIIAMIIAGVRNEQRRHWQEKHVARSRTAYLVPHAAFHARSESCSTAPGQIALLLAWPAAARSANDAKLMTICRNWTWSRVKEALQLHLRHQDAPPLRPVTTFAQSQLADTVGSVSAAVYSGKTELQLIAIANKFLTQSL